VGGREQGFEELETDCSWNDLHDGLVPHAPLAFLVVAWLVPVALQCGERASAVRMADRVRGEGKRTNEMTCPTLNGYGIGIPCGPSWTAR
jgi:hypothetical protein